MAMVINEAHSKHYPPPKGFPVCENFKIDEMKDDPTSTSKCNQHLDSGLHMYKFLEHGYFKNVKSCLSTLLCIV